MWRGGCIIRSRFLGNIKAAYDKNPDLDNLLLDDFFREAIDTAQESWRKVVANAVKLGVQYREFLGNSFLWRISMIFSLDIFDIIFFDSKVWFYAIEKYPKLFWLDST